MGVIRSDIDMFWSELQDSVEYSSAVGCQITAATWFAIHVSLPLSLFFRIDELTLIK